MSGCVIARAERLGADSQLSQIIGMVERAQEQRAPVQDLTDRISAIFVPTVFCISTIVFITWGVSLQQGWAPNSYLADGQNPWLLSLKFALAVVVISCPCALGLATPTAVMVGTGIGAKLGVLFKGAAEFQTLSSVDTVVFDKTGTLTVGKPVVTDVIVAPGTSSGSSDGGGSSKHGSRDGDGEHTSARDHDDHRQPQSHAFGAAASGSLSDQLSQPLLEFDESGDSSGSVSMDAVDESNAGPRCTCEPGSCNCASGSSSHDECKQASSRDRSDRSLSEEHNEMIRLFRAVVRAAASVESGSTHPLANALVQLAEDAFNGLPSAESEEFKSEPGHGVKCKLDGRAVCVGTVSWMEQCGVEVGSQLLDDKDMLEGRGRTVVIVGIDGMALGLVALMDELRPNAIPTVRFLEAQGKKVVMLTGDNQKTADAIGSELGLPADCVVAGVLPENKQEEVRRLQSEGAVVAMLGDGINDAPALAAADVGVAVGSGTNVAKEAAGVVLVKSAIKDVAVAVDLATTVFNRIKLNLGLSFVYNALGIPIAAGALYPATHLVLPPELAGLAMAVSSVCVVLSSLLLYRYSF